MPLAPSRNRHAGWTIARQQTFLETLKHTRRVRHAASAAGLTSRAAYQLRARSGPFAAAWDEALALPECELAPEIDDAGPQLLPRLARIHPLFRRLPQP